jgi:thiosulfate/3-mercaptopyruvate sulfurtransferase
MKKYSLRILSLLFSVLMIIVAAYAKDYANPQILVTPTDVEKNIGKWIILDCRDKKDYDKGHIPTAITLGGDCGKVLRDTSPGVNVLEPEKYEEILGNAGIDNKKTVVIYGDTKNITHAAVGFWILDNIADLDVRFLNGGIEAWLAEGKSLETKENKLPKTKFVVNAKKLKKSIITTEEVIDIAKGKGKDVQLIDVRTPEEYAGIDVRKPATRGGHIPNTTALIPHTKLFDKATGKIKSAEELEKLFSDLDKNKKTVLYCQTGTRTALVYIVMKLLGFKDVVVYDDSWAVYGAREDTPVCKSGSGVFK